MTALWPVGTRVEIVAGWWGCHDLPTTGTITRHLPDDRLFAYAISIGDGREWAMAAGELRCA